MVINQSGGVLVRDPVYSHLKPAIAIAVISAAIAIAVIFAAIGIKFDRTRFTYGFSRHGLTGSGLPGVRECDFRGRSPRKSHEDTTEGSGQVRICTRGTFNSE